MQPEQPNQQPNWQYSSQNQAVSPAEQPTDSPQATDAPIVSWSASEFVAYHKNAGWYVSMFFVVLLLAVIVFLITGGDFISAGSTVLIGILFLAYATRKPRVLTYTITSDGVQVGDKQYSFSELRSFAVIDEGTLRSIMLLPTQRFKPAISMYYEPDAEQQIIETLGGYLPLEERQQELIDKFMHKIRF